MNLYQQLQAVREQLENIGAHDDSIDLVDMLLRKTEPMQHEKSNISRSQVLHRMLHMREVIDNYNIYNDLQELLSERDESEVVAREDSAPAAYEETERRPRPKSYYKAQKERANKKKA